MGMGYRPQSTPARRIQATRSADPGSECEVGLDNAKPVHGDRR